MRRWILPFIFLIALLLRTVNLSNFPSGFTPDEASFGYNAYSLLQTGKDQWGHSFPLVLESFGDFKPPLYAYILMPFVGLFGLSEWVVRIPNALLGSSVVVVTYYLALEFGKKWLKRFGKSQLQFANSLPEQSSQLLAIIAALLLAISPWHIMMSRGGFEANLTTFLMPLAILAFLKGLKDDPTSPRLRRTGWMRVSAIVFGLNMFSYHSARLVTPLIAAFLVTLYAADTKSISKSVVSLRKFTQFIGIILFFVVLNVYTFTLGAGTRAADISVLGGAAEEAAGPRLDAINSGMSPTLAKIIHNQYAVASGKFLSNYRQYFSLKFLFVDGPAEATYGMMPGRGVLYWFEGLFLIGFAFYLVKYRKSLNKVILVLVFWLFAAPIPAALAQGVGFAGNRSVIMLPALQILSAVGVLFIYSIISRRVNWKLLVGVFILLVFISTYQFTLEYFGTSRERFSPQMLYGRREMVEYLQDKGYTPDSTKVVIDKRLSEPQIHFAFYMQIDPVLYQSWTKQWEVYREKDTNFIDQLDEYEMGQYLFTTNFIEKTERFGSDYILVGKPEEFVAETVPTHVIRYPDGMGAIYIVEPGENAFASVN